MENLIFTGFALDDEERLEVHLRSAEEGAKALDRIKPGWESMIAFEKLTTVPDGGRDVLAQVFGESGNAPPELLLDAERYGFYLPTTANDNAILLRAWHRVIFERLLDRGVHQLNAEEGRQYQTAT